LKAAQAHGTPRSSGRLPYPIPTSHGASIGVNESSKFFGQVSEKLQFSNIQRLTQNLKQKQVPTFPEGGSKPTKEKAEFAGGNCQEREARVIV